MFRACFRRRHMAALVLNGITQHNERRKKRFRPKAKIYVGTTLLTLRWRAPYIAAAVKLSGRGERIQWFAETRYRIFQLLLTISKRQYINLYKFDIPFVCPPDKIWGAYCFCPVCLSVCLSVCLFEDNFNIGHNF